MTAVYFLKAEEQSLSVITIFCLHNFCLHNFVSRMLISYRDKIISYLKEEMCLSVCILSA